MKKNSILRFVGAGAVVMAAFLAAQTPARPAATDVSLTGLVTCSHCLDLGQHKGFTPWSWAMYKVSQGDSIVFVTSGKTYSLQG